MSEASSPTAASGDEARSSLGWRHLVVAAALVTLVGGAWWRKNLEAVAFEERMMKAGLEALYAGNDPAGAAAQFRSLLERNPTHYSATYQLATALDRDGKPAEARPVWDTVVKLAEALGDKPTADATRARFAAPAAVAGTGVRPEDPMATAHEALMKAGLDALNVRNDAKAAAAQFRKVLEQNPTHYGATFQLARALDRAGEPAAARPLWEKVLKMAESFNDNPTADTARARLARGP